MVLWANMKFRLVVFLALFSSAACQAQPLYNVEQKRDWLLVGSGCALAVGGLIAHNNVQPLTLDQINALDRANINSFDRGAVRSFRGATASDIAMGVSVAMPFILLADRKLREEWKAIGVMWGETLLLQSGVNGIVKSLTKRTRPYVYDPNTPLDRKTDRDARLSFYSGHTGTSAAMSFLTARILSDRVSDKRTRIVIWSAAAVYPAVVGILRVESGRHFPSDVIAGYLVGATIGYVVPGLHRAGESKGLAVGSSRVDGSRMVRLTWRF